MSSAMADAGIPPEPDPATVDAFVRALDAIDPDIVHGDPEKAVDRGRNVCSSVNRSSDETKLVQATDARFSSPDHPDGFGPEVARQILAVVRAHLCSDS